MINANMTAGGIEMTVKSHLVSEINASACSKNLIVSGCYREFSDWPATSI